MKKRFYWLKALILAFSVFIPILPAGCETAPAGQQGSVTETSSEREAYTMDGKTFIFLGSSVTYGSAAGGRSFVDMIAERHDCTCIKLAVSGTTLVDNGANSYVSRLKSESAKYPVCDHIIVQLSTNDATGNKPLGVLSDSTDINDFDTSTVIGAIEYIIAYAKQTWNCKVSFYTGTYFQNANYEKMVAALHDIQQKWGIGVLDMYNDPEMRAVSDEDYSEYMADPIHPTEYGYEHWWLPEFEEFLLSEGEKG